MHLHARSTVSTLSLFATQTLKQSHRDREVDRDHEHGRSLEISKYSTKLCVSFISIAKNATRCGETQPRPIRNFPLSSIELDIASRVHVPFDGQEACSANFAEKVVLSLCVILLEIPLICWAKEPQTEMDQKLSTCAHAQRRPL